MASTGWEYTDTSDQFFFVMKPLRSFVVFVVLALGAAACSSDAEPVAGDDASTETTADTDTTTTPEAEPTAGDEVDDDTVDTTTAPEPAEETPVEDVSEPRTASASGEATFGEDFPDIIGVEAVQDGSGAWNFSVTVSSPYDTPERYADAWRVVGPDGNELGIRILAHDHANEQPFTRAQSGIEIPEDVTEVTVQGRDLANGWGGAELVVPLS